MACFEKQDLLKLLPDTSFLQTLNFLMLFFWSAWWRISKTKRKNGCYLLLDHTSYSSFLDSNLRADMWSSASWLVSSSSLLRSKGSFCLLYKTSRERSYSSFPKSAGLTPNPHWSDNTDSSVSAVTSGWLLMIAFFYVASKLCKFIEDI